MTEPTTPTVTHTHSHSTVNVTGALTRKYGPLPGYAYVIILVAIGYVYYKRTGHSLFTSGNPTTDPTAATDPSSTGLATVGGTDGLSGVTGGGSSGVNGGPATLSNAQWGTEAVNYLITEKHADPASASNAIARYLSGKTITTETGRNLISQAIAGIGPPPQGTLPVRYQPTPVPVKSAPKPPTTLHPPTHIFPSPHPSPTPPKKTPPKQPPKSQQTYYVVRSGDTLSGIAARFYGNASDWHKIYTANQHVIGSNPNHIVPGMRLLIPA